VVFRDGLHRFPQDPQILVYAVGGVQVFRVVAVMGPIVGLAQRDVKYPWLALPEVLEGGMERDDIESFIVPDPRNFCLYVIEQIDTRVISAILQRIIARNYWETRADSVEDEGESVPCGECCDPTSVTCFSFNHSKTVTFGFGILRLLLMCGSENPQRVSL
jgi:hypothetical protein